MYKYLLAFSLLISSTSWASSETFFCNVCENADDFKLAAMIVSSNNVFVNEIKIINPFNGEISVFDTLLVVSEGGSFGGPVEGPLTIVLEKPASSPDQYNANILADAYGSFHEFFNANRDINSSLMGSALDVLGSSTGMGALNNYYNSSQTLGSAISSYAGASLAIASKMISVNIVVEFRFADGSTLVAKITDIKANKDIEFAVEKVTDADGNDIPTTKQEFEAKADFSYNFSTYDAVRDFLDAAARYGIPIVNVTNVSQLTGSITDVICDSKGRCRKI
ncbi:MAG: hypothetical protein OCD00_08845 [Colwellia sp.]